MNARHLEQWKAQLAATKRLQRQWLRVYNQAERTILRNSKKMIELEKKIELATAK